MLLGAGVWLVCLRPRSLEGVVAPFSVSASGQNDSLWDALGTMRIEADYLFRNVYFNQILTASASIAKVSVVLRNIMKKLKALVVMAPGTNIEVSSRQFRSLCDVVTQRVTHKFNYFDVVFIESENPTLAESVGKAVGCGVEEIIIYPSFLNEGENVNGHIQNEIIALSNNHPFVHFTLLDIDGSAVIESENNGQNIVAK